MQRNPSALRLFTAISLALTSGACDGGGVGASASAAASAPSTAAASSSATPPLSSEPAATGATPALSATPSASATPSVATKPQPQPQPRKPKSHETWVEGRPFIVDDQARVATLTLEASFSDERLAIDTSSLSDNERIQMIEHFSHWSLGEHASIASFARFTLQLLALGAPPALVQASIAAGDDERRHAELGFSFLRALGVELAPGPIAIGGSLEQSSLESIFRMVVRESILGETFSALEALHVVPWIRDAVFQRELARLAEDEARHAELGFVFAAWAIGQSPALSAVLEQELASFVEPEIRACAGQREWGVLSTEERRALREVTWREVIGPLCQSLLQLAVTPQSAETRYAAPGGCS